MDSGREPPPSETRRADAPAGRAVVPIVSLTLTVGLACTDAYLRDDVRPIARATSSPARADRPVDSGLTRPASPPPSAPATAAGDVAPAPRPVMLAPADIDVRLVGASSSGVVSFGIDGPYRVHAADRRDPAGTGDLLAQGARLRTASAGRHGDKVEINGVAVGGPAVVITPEVSGTLSVRGTGYHGSLILDVSSGSLVAINRVALGDYVAGVVHAEMPARFAVEARRAQAVITRTYALYHSLRGDTLRDDQGSQVYAGLDRDSLDARRITESTSGEILTFDGIPFEAFFHSTCGGATGSAERIFLQRHADPLKRGVGCGHCRRSPHYSWTRKLDRARLEAMYPGLSPAGVRPGDCDESGRLLDVEVVDRRGEVIDRPAAIRFRNQYNQSLPLKRRLLSSLWTTIEGQTVIHGQGFGHGVGLCQYGADGLGDAGRSYREILEYYYPGSAITRVPE